MESPISPVRQRVFLNVPFDPEYSPLFIALIAGLTALGREPHCVLEVPSSGRNRLDRIYDLVASCGASVHDLSRVSLSGHMGVPRFNMPFELGIAYGLSRQASHSFFVFEERELRLQASLSDLNGHDPQIHRGTQAGILGCLLDCFANPQNLPPLQTMKMLTRNLSRTMTKLQREQGLTNPFRPYLFRQAVEAAIALAEAEGLIK